ncbi:hypothetical protein LOTGIDRAFT_174642 [Lottia gigantea]|uniref:snRNA-activating protein complex subunit 1 n=1 Tax=Lottia gigantea TaxID=225164 RepID=V3ZZU4_LOTGI|nr:hypothetical protein LOTGIDRAFT_174642 [Lottia gigantea]ESO97073.1 hypothetical protein LOTGIDRAFT_174642 [Lottia gigantea]
MSDDDDDDVPNKKKPRRPKTKSVTQPTLGIKQDFETLIERFVAMETVRYENFAEIWREMKLSLLQSGRQNQQEAREFLEEVFDIAICYYLPPFNFQVRTCGLYLMYGLYNTQYSIPPVKFRVTMDMWKDLTDYQNEAHSQQHYDIDFVFQYLRSANAFSFVFSRKEMRLRATNSGLSSYYQQDLGPMEQSNIVNIVSTDDLRQLTAVDYQYQQLKIALAGPGAKKPDVSLAVIQENIVDSITNSIKQHQEKVKKLISKTKAQMSDSNSEEMSQSTQDDEDETTGSRRAKLRAKAFGSGKTSKRRSHRKSANQTQLTELKGQTTANTDDKTASKNFIH